MLNHNKSMKFKIYYFKKIIVLINLFKTNKSIIKNLILIN